jgi:hypothetical protein
VIESQRKGKEQGHLKKTSLGPLRKGQRLDTSETKHAQARSTSHQSKARETTRSSPCTHASSPWTNATPSGRMHVNHLAKQSSCFSLALTSQLHWSNWCARSPGTWASHQSDRWTTPVRPMTIWEQHELKNCSKPLGNHLNACSKPKHAQASPLVDNAWIKPKMQKKCNLELIK